MYRLDLKVLVNSGSMFHIIYASEVLEFSIPYKHV